MAPQTKPSPELEAFAKSLVENIREVSRQQNAEMLRDMTVMIDHRILAGGKTRLHS